MNAETHWKLPSETFRSAGAFTAFLARERGLLDLRYGLEGTLAAPGLSTLEGSCGLCLRATQFSVVGPVETGAAARPNWREAQHCGCPDRLSSRFRAMLQFVQGQIAPPAWANLLLLGAAQAIEPRLQGMVGSITVRARSGRLLRAPVFGQQTHHLVLSCDHLHAEPALDAVLVALRDAMLPGAALVMTAPFDAHAANTVPAERHQPGVLGWDILTRLSRAGFATPAAHLYWSQEFGYLGPFNFIFSAMAA